MSDRSRKKPHKDRQYEENNDSHEIEDFKKDDFRGKRNPKKNKRDYDKKYRDGYGEDWN